MNDEKIKILEMIQNGKITAAEGLELLKAIDDSVTQQNDVTKTGSRFLRIRITNDQNKKVNVNIPLALLKVATKFAGIGMKFIPEEARQEMHKKGIDLSEIDFAELIKLIDQGLASGKLVDIDTDDQRDGHTKVEIYIE
ncbi:MAG TPA: hypothetical protein VN370_05050 [Desulfitobacteriaceae bacterium]|jgi:hypothetical protein|nr:hypothetical protein [Desulfitobacteriaceae bacterium]